MKKRHLWYIIPISIFVGVLITSLSFGSFLDHYPVANCIMNVDNMLQADTNKLPFTIESQREAIQWRCAKEFIDFNITDYDEIFIMDGDE